MIRVMLPYHLQRLANLEREIALEVPSPPTLGGVLDALENLLSGAAWDAPRPGHKRTAAVHPLLRLRGGFLSRPAGYRAAR